MGLTRAVALAYALAVAAAVLGDLDPASPTPVPASTLAAVAAVRAVVAATGHTEGLLLTGVRAAPLPALPDRRFWATDPALWWLV